ncbi:MAG: hypothetical protein QF404_08675 [Planctomycetota bacterium]|jgi:hypothetical protein|nr:hypothetical protein [Planctomycetota bacterium]
MLQIPQLPSELVQALLGVEVPTASELIVNPCPRGYELRSVGGQWMCVLEGHDEISLDKARAITAQQRRPAPYQSANPPGKG